MPSTIINQRDLILYDVSVGTPKKIITAFIKKHVPNAHWSLRHGTPYRKNGEECQRIFITFDRVESVDEFMKHQTFELNGQPLKVTRSLRKSCLPSNRFGTGLKIKIHTSDNDYKHSEKLNENDLKKYFGSFGEILQCKWTNMDQTEALFIFSHYDSVDKILLNDPSPEIKGIKVYLEKTRTTKDYVTYEHFYVIHVTNLPLHVTSEELSQIFNVPIGFILLYPCFRLEQSLTTDGRSSSEAWITNFNNEKVAQSLAQEKIGTFVGKNRIECEVLPESINEEELCERFNKGQCSYSADTCYYRHLTCSQPDDCDDKSCWLGHNEERKTVSINHPEYRSEDAPYRVKFNNLPSNITHQDLMKRLKLPSKSSQHLILQPSDSNSTSSRMAYLIRQPSENKLRQQIDQWHNKPFSSPVSLKIQCQLEINQDYFEWNDSTEIVRSFDNSRCASPAPSIQSAYSNRTNPVPRYSSAVNKVFQKDQISSINQINNKPR